MRSHFRPRFSLRRPLWLICLAIATALLCLTMPVTRTMASVGMVEIQANATLDQQGRTAYAAGDYAAAAAAFAQAANEYQSAGQMVQAALAFANLSLSYQQLGQWNEAKAALEKALGLTPMGDAAPPDVLSSRGQVLSIQGQLLFSQGDNIGAAEVWAQAAVAYKQANQPREQVRAQVNQVQALQSAGFYDRARSQIEKALTSQPSDDVTLDALRTYGELLRLTGERDEAGETLEQALTLAEELALPDAIASIYNSLGVLAETNDDPDAALNYYQLATELAPELSSTRLGIAAQVSQLRLFIEQTDWQVVATILPTLTEQLQAQPPNRDNIYARLTYGQLLLDLRQAVDVALTQREADAAKLAVENATVDLTDEATQQLTTDEESLQSADALSPENDALLTLAEALPQGDTIATLLLETYGAAQNLNDIKAQAYALSRLGRLYSQTQQWEIAKQQTLTALNLAQGANLPDLEYQLQEQLCQILQNTDSPVPGEAIKACRAAVSTVNLLRNDLAAKGSDATFEFQKQVEPVYRNFIDLLLKTDANDAAYEANLQEARQVLESLQLAELDNFFREACLEIQSVNLDEVVDEKTAVIYPIVLEDRLEIILSLTDKITRHSSWVSKAELDDTIDKWSDGIRLQEVLFPAAAKQVSDGTTNEFIQDFPSPDIDQFSEQLYQWLITPIEEDLNAADVDTLVFVLDDKLRNVSMAALSDGQNYLIEKYAVALTPGLQLVEPKPIARDSIQAFIAGVSEAQQGFIALPAIEIELANVSGIVDGNALLNDKVTNEVLEVEIATSSAPIVHLATHGQFGSTAEDTFILTWQDQLNVNELSQLIKTSELSRDRELELLVLSACETARGDDRSVLGIAGVATRSGARSTLATLWQVNDASTAELISEFYKQLTSNQLSKAKALQKAQLKVLKDPNFNSPYYWSPFILLGNWL